MPYGLAFDAHNFKISNVLDGNNKEHIRFSIHFAFHLKQNAAEATAMICTAYGENAVSHTTCKKQKFRQRNFGLEYVPRAGRLQRLKRTNWKYCWI